MAVSWTKLRKARKQRLEPETRSDSSVWTDDEVELMQRSDRNQSNVMFFMCKWIHSNWSF